MRQRRVKHQVGALLYGSEDPVHGEGVHILLLVHRQVSTSRRNFIASLDGRRAGAQVSEHDSTCLERVTAQAALVVEIRLLHDELNGVLVSANRPIGAEAEKQTL